MLESFDVLLRLLILGLELEELGRVGLGLGLAGDELGGEVLALGGPFGNELVELTLLLLHGGGVGIGTLNVNHEVLNLASKTVLGLLKRSALAKSLLNLLLSLGELGGQLALGLLELVSELLSELGESSDLMLSILQLAEELTILGLKALLGGGQLGDHAGVLLNLDGAVGQLELELLGELLGGGLGLDNAIVLLGKVQQLAGETLLLLLQVVLQLLELIDLVTHLTNSILVLLAESGGGGLLVEVGLLEIAAETRQLLLSLLVELDLSGGGATGLVEALGKLVQLLGQVGSLLLDLSAGLTLGFELLLDLFDAGGELLDLLAGLVDGGLLVLELGHEGSVLEVLALGGLVHVALDALQVVDGSEGLLQLRLQLPLDLVQVGTRLLLALEVVLQLVEGRLKLSLDLGQVVDFVLLGLKVVGGFPVALLHLLLLAGELGDELVLLGHLILEGLDLVLLGVLL